MSAHDSCPAELDRVWAALGITSYTGKHASEHVTELKARVAELEAVLDDVGALVGKLSYVGGRVIVRHGPEIKSVEANKEWWEQLRMVAVAVRAALSTATKPKEPKT